MGFFDRVRDALDPDRALMVSMDALIEGVGVRYAVGDPERWAPGKPLELLLAGYVGTRNTGADVRVEEMIRQLRHVVGDDELELTVMTYDPELTRGYFRAVRQVVMPVVFPPFLSKECPRHHGVVACEGSMFKSKFASALTTMMAGSLGMANAENKLSVGYGAEAGDMTPALQRYVEKHCRRSLVICRNEPSRDVLARLGVRTASGTDTAWTFEGAPPEVGERLLLDAGWDGETPVLALCPVNPYWWPVKPDLAKAVAHRFAGEFDVEHYRSVYFHAWSEEREAKLDRYLDAIAAAYRGFARDRRVFPILVGMEQLDRFTCERLAERLPEPAPLFVSDDYDMFDLVAVLRRCRMLVSSRYHAIVTSMSALVPSAGITMDERIRNLMNDRGHEDLFLEVDDEDLEERLLAILHRLHDDGEAISHEIARVLPGQLALMGQMGIDFADEVARVYPDLPRADLPRTWQAHLPPMSSRLQELLAAHC